MLDTEGIDVAVSEGMNEYHIFTLTVLLTSVLIYNFQGIPTKQSVEELKYPFCTIEVLWARATF